MVRNQQHPPVKHLKRFLHKTVMSVCDLKSACFLIVRKAFVDRNLIDPKKRELLSTCIDDKIGGQICSTVINAVAETSCI